MSPTSPPALAALYEGAYVFTRRLGLVRLHILSPDGRPIATFHRGRVPPRIDPPSWKRGEAAANVAMILFYREHLGGRRGLPRPWR